MNEKERVRRSLTVEDIALTEKARRASYPYDWKNRIKGWRYKGDAPTDPEWLADRDLLFKENGNGWWWYQGYNIGNHIKYTGRKDPG